MAIKTLKLALKIEVGSESRNTSIFISDFKHVKWLDND